jgi:hypothetical protein
LEERYQALTGRPLEYGRLYWTPPLPPQAALALERNQIEEGLGLAALVSLTDHDNTQASTQLRVLESESNLPLSLEWTVPLGKSFLHLGIHNLPPSRACAWLGELNSYTRHPSGKLLQELLAGLNDFRQTLVVLNHPMWDEPAIGAEAHSAMLSGFLRDHGRWVHALELNGLRPRAENRYVLLLAQSMGYPVLSGGDRHGSSPSSVLNLTHASSFVEFVSEVRHHRSSTILTMPQQAGPHGLRYVECVLDVLREYPGLPGRRRWMDRAFIREPDGSSTPLAHYWAETGLTSSLLGSLGRLLYSGPFRSALTVALSLCQDSPL